jgi:hypothetical protein
VKARRNHLRAEQEELDLVGAPYRLVALRRQRRSRSGAAQSTSEWVGNPREALAGPPEGQDAA